MPATSYDYAASSYRIRCLGCGTQVHTSTPYNRDAVVLGSDRRVEEIFPWYSRGAFSTRCRECTRANRRAAAARRRTTPTRSNPLGVGRRFGVELELIFPAGTTAANLSAALREAGLSGWQVTTDCSLRSYSTYSGGRGYEIVSPILAGENGIDQIRTATRVLRSLGAKPNRSCGMHVHHEVVDLGLAGIKRLYRSWANNQGVINGLVAESRRPGATESRFCNAVSQREADTVEAARDLRTIRHGGKFKALNLSYVGSRGTIEIRQHQGTCDPEKIVSWVRFGQGLVDAAAEGRVVEPASRMRDFLSAIGERLDETARTFLLGRTVEFGAVAV